MKTMLTLLAASALALATPGLANIESSPVDATSVVRQEGAKPAKGQQEKKGKKAGGAKKAQAGDEKGKGEGGAKGDEAAQRAAVVKAQLPFYPLATCVISNEPLGEDAVDVVVEGRLVRTCCRKCAKMVREAPERVIAKIDEKAIEAQKANYPLTNCLVSDEALDSMGGPLDIIHEGRLVRLCCKGCVKSFQKSPARYFETINAAMIANQKETYAYKTCPVSGEEIAGAEGVVDVLYGDQLVRLCCKRCAKAFDKEPAKFIAKLKSAK